MSSKTQKNPSIRFKGFTDAWEQRKLMETNTSFTDGNYGESYPSGNDMSDSRNGVPFLRGSNLKNGKLDNSGANYITLEKHKELTSGHLVYDDIVIAVRGSLGALGYVDIDNVDWNINSQLAIIRTDKSELNGAFVIQFLSSNKGQKELLSRQTGTALKQLPIKQLQDVPVPKPELAEQNKISEFFRQLDDTIALHQRQLDNYKELKKAMLQKIFNQELRFKNDDGNDYPDWREAMLEEICLYKSSNISLDSFKEYNGEEIYPLYDANSLVLNIDKYDQENEYVSIIKDGAGVGRIRYCEGKSSVLGTMGYLLPTDTVDIKFLYFRLQIINFLSYVSGSTIPHIYFKDYKKENIGLPCEDEQKKIADVLSALDIKIEILVQKIEALKQQKKGFMQQMFV